MSKNDYLASKPQRVLSELRQIERPVDNARYAIHLEEKTYFVETITEYAQSLHESHGSKAISYVAGPTVVNFLAVESVEAFFHHIRQVREAHWFRRLKAFGEPCESFAEFLESRDSPRELG